jgi:hypothetical protein
MTGAEINIYYQFSTYLMKLFDAFRFSVKRVKDDFFFTNYKAHEVVPACYKVPSEEAWGNNKTFRGPSNRKKNSGFPQTRRRTALIGRRKSKWLVGINSPTIPSSLLNINRVSIKAEELNSTVHVMIHYSF